jgi:hypothetical protein
MPFRLIRTAAFAAVSLGLAMTAHVIAGGSVPGPAMAAGFALAFGAAWPLAGRERGTPAILALLTSQQLAMHMLFAAAHDSHPITGVAHMVHSSGGLVPDLGMLVAHGWAIALTALCLARGEAALWGLLRRLGVRLIAVLLPLPATPFLRLPYAEPPVMRSALLRHAVTGRGPPAVIGIR